MSTQTFDFGSNLERLMNDRRVRIGGLIAGALVIVGSMVVVNVSNGPSLSKATRAVAVLPDAPLNIPIMRQWPYPAAPKVKPEGPASLGKKVSKRGVLTARR